MDTRMNRKRLMAALVAAAMAVSGLAAFAENGDQPETVEITAEELVAREAEEAAEQTEMERAVREAEEAKAEADRQAAAEEAAKQAEAERAVREAEEAKAEAVEQAAVEETAEQTEVESEEEAAEQIDAAETEETAGEELAEDATETETTDAEEADSAEEATLAEETEEKPAEEPSMEEEELQGEDAWSEEEETPDDDDPEPPEEAVHFSASISIRAEKDTIDVGEMLKLTIEGLDSTNLPYKISWEQADRSVPDEDKEWEKLDETSDTLELPVNEETASFVYRAVLEAENGESIATSGFTFEIDKTEEIEDAETIGQETHHESELETTGEEEDPALTEEVNVSLEKEETEDQEKHYRTITRVSRKITQYVLAAAEETGEEETTAPSLYEEEVIGLEENPDFVLPENRSITVELTWDVEEPVLGDIAHFTATLEGYEELDTSLQWQISPDGEKWADIEEANELAYDVEMVPQNYRHYWRVLVTVNVPGMETGESAEENSEAPDMESEDSGAEAAQMEEQENPVAEPVESDHAETDVEALVEDVSENEEKIEADSMTAANEEGTVPTEEEIGEQALNGEDESLAEEQTGEETASDDTLTEEENGNKAPVILKEITEDTILEVIREEYDGEKDIEIIEVVEETTEVIEVAGEEEIPAQATEEEVPAEPAENEEPAEALKAEEAEEVQE